MGESHIGRRAKLYTLNKSGHKQLSDEKKDWARAALAMREVLNMERPSALHGFMHPPHRSLRESKPENL